MHGDIAEGIVIKILAIYTAYKISVLIGEIPCVASSDAVIAVIQEVDLIAIEDRTVVTVDVYPLTGILHHTAVPKVLVVVITRNGFAGRHLMVGVLEPQVIFVGHDILRLNRYASDQC